MKMFKARVILDDGNFIDIDDTISMKSDDSGKLFVFVKPEGDDPKNRQAAFNLFNWSWIKACIRLDED